MTDFTPIVATADSYYDREEGLTALHEESRNEITELLMAHELLNGVREAWNVTGWNAPYHHRQQRRLGREWPRLAVIVRKIAGGVR